jgi:hypothetical protein
MMNSDQDTVSTESGRLRVTIDTRRRSDRASKRTWRQSGLPCRPLWVGFVGHRRRRLSLFFFFHWFWDLGTGSSSFTGGTEAFWKKTTKLYVLDKKIKKQEIR